MLNLLRYADGGVTSYAEYAARIEPFLARVGAEVVYFGDAGTVLVAPSDWEWDAVLLVRYPSRTAFTAMVADPEYQQITGLRTVALDAHQFRYAFGNTLTEEESNTLHDAWTIPGAGLPLFQDAAANFFPHSPAKVDTHLADRGPLLLTSGTEDHTVPLKVTKEVFDMYSKGPADTEFHVFEGKGHSLTIDSGWQEVADVALNWLAAKGF